VTGVQTPRDLLGAAEADLVRAGVASPRVDAELLLCHVLDASRSALVTLDTIEPDQHARFAELVRRRAAREPLQHLVGTAPFRHLNLAVGPGVFIPRPETELLVDDALRVLTPNDTVVDLCAGSGALGLAVLDECPGVSVIAVERDPEALKWLRRNAASTSLDVIEGDVADPNLLFAHYGLIDVVLSNPPYVPESIPVAPEVLADPKVAVFACYRQ
jgi:release factor glutamine methyltransferase